MEQKINFTKKQIGHISHIENQIKGAFEKIKSGDRSDLRSGKLYNLEFLHELGEEDFYPIKKYLKEKIVGINKKIDVVELHETKDLMLEMTLCDQMKHEIKTFQQRIIEK